MSLEVLNSPPPYRVQIAKNRPITRNLQVLALMIGGYPHILTPRLCAPMFRSGAALIGGARGANTGQGVYLGAVGDQFSYSGLSPLNEVTDTITWFGWAYSGTVSSASKIVGRFGSPSHTVGSINFGNGTDTAPLVYAKTSAGVFPQRVSTVTPYVGNKPYFIAGQRSTAQTFPDIYIDGVLSNGTTYSPGSGNLSDRATQVTFNDGANALVGSVFLMGLFTRFLSSYEHLSLARNPWQLLERSESEIFYSLPSGNITISLTGQSSTFSYGTLVPALSRALSGLSASFSRGTLIPALAKTLTGQSATFSGGTLTPVTGITVNLTGQSFTGSVGSLKAALAVNLLGQSVTASGGTITPSVGGNVSVNLSGISGTFSYGTLTAGQGLPPETMEFSWSGKKAKFSFKTRYMNFDLD